MCVDIPGNSTKNISCPQNTEFQFKVGWLGSNESMCEPGLLITNETKSGIRQVNKTIFQNVFCKTIPCELYNKGKVVQHIAVFFICKGNSDKHVIRLLKRIISYR